MEGKILFFEEKNQNLRKLILLIMFFLIESFLTIASYQFLKIYNFENK